MSDRVTNAEVEDVLSSIRRLVSEDNRPGQTKVTPAEPGADRPPRVKTERLVLTPSFRVPDEDVVLPSRAEEEAQMESSGMADQMPDDVPGGPSEDVAPFQLRTSHTDSVKDEGTDQPVGSGAVTGDANSKFVDETSDAQSGSPVNLTEINWDETPLVLGARVPPAEDKAGPDADENIADIDEGEANTAVEAQDDQDMAETEDVDTTSVDTKEADVPLAETDAKAAVLTAKITALETAIGKISDTWEPDNAGESDYAGTAAEVMAWEDDVEEPAPFQKPMLAPVMRKTADVQAAEMVEDAEVSYRLQEASPFGRGFVAHPSQPDPSPQDDIAEAQSQQERAAAFHSTAKPTPVVEDAGEPIVETVASSAETIAPTVEDTADASIAAPPQGDALEDDTPEEGASETDGLLDVDQVLDEEALREMIGDVVRSELQGALGERITRNVRKLVRREIHRALTAQELE